MLVVCECTRVWTNPFVAILVHLHYPNNRNNFNLSLPCAKCKKPALHSELSGINVIICPGVKLYFNMLFEGKWVLAHLVSSQIESIDPSWLTLPCSQHSSYRPGSPHHLNTNVISWFTDVKETEQATALRGRTLYHDHNENHFRVSISVGRTVFLISITL